MERVWRWVWLAMAGVLLPGGALAQERPYDWGWGHPMGWMWGVWGGGMMLVMLAFWVLVIVGIVAGIRWLLTQGRVTGPDRALEILRERYARGEIGKEEFDARMRDLR